MSVDTAPAPNTSSGNDAIMDGGATSPQLGTNSSQQSNLFTLRALVSSKEAGVIIGKAGKNVADLREATGVKAGVSKVVPGVPERVLSVSGSPEQVTKAYSSILASVAENPSAQNEGLGGGISPSITVKLLVANALMGSVIGKAGATIQALQAEHGAKIITVKEMLPGSTERIVSVEGPLSAVDATVRDLAKIIADQADSTRLHSHALYQPGGPAGGAGAGAGGVGGFQSPFGAGPMAAGNFRNGAYNQRRTSGNNNGGVNRSAGGAAASQAVPTPSNPELRTQNISIPSDMVGCIIGRGGSKINEIRTTSGAKISIAKDAHDESGERMFTITGSSENLERALYMLYGQLEEEKSKRIASQSHDDGGRHDGEMAVEGEQ